MPEHDQKGGLHLSRADLFAVVAISLVGLLVFSPGHRAGPASEDFDFYRAARNADLSQILKVFIPTTIFGTARSRTWATRRRLSDRS
jgi:hypothetical protein